MYGCIHVHKKILIFTQSAIITANQEYNLRSTNLDAEIAKKWFGILQTVYWQDWYHQPVGTQLHGCGTRHWPRKHCLLRQGPELEPEE